MRSRPLHECVRKLEQICDQVDNASEITPEMMTSFEEAHLEQKEKVDNWISYLRALDTLAIDVSVWEQYYRERRKKAEALKLRMREYVASLIKATPNLEFRGTDGARLCIQQNSAASLTIESNYIEEKTYKQLPPDIIPTDEQIPYLEQVAVWRWKTDELKRDLQAMLPVTWASAERGYHLRIR